MITRRKGEGAMTRWMVPFLALAAAGCTPAIRAEAPTGAATNVAEAAPVDPSARRAFYGELHLHTAYSFDAWGLMGTRIGPDEAYRFARGERVNYGGKLIRRGWPLDFMAVTDHSENMGLLNQLDDPTTAFAKSEIGQEILKNPIKSFYMLREARYQHREIPGLNSKEAARSAWAREVAAANANYQPGKFTTFIGYEWSQMNEGRYNLHRNVIFKGSEAPLPFTSADSGKPEDLWSYLEANRAQGRDVIAIPHNANGSNGLMYDWVMSDGRPIDEAYAQRRLMNEPLSEISQNKGQSETLPELSPNDEFANFEIWDVLITQRDTKSKPNGSYVRQAYGRGLVIADKVGANPYKFGVVGGADFHNGISASDEKAYAGSPGPIDPDNLPDGDEAKRRLGIIQTRSLIDDDAEHEGRAPMINNPLLSGSSAITGVWAEANNRESIFAALKRKETFATSGTRLRVRFFGGWNFASGMFGRGDWVREAYRTGAPMGGDLPAGRAGGAPTFIVEAVKDPDGANLDRVQVVKVWLDGGDYREKVFDVALSGGRKVDPKTGRAPSVGTTVDIAKGTYSNTIGAAQLRAVWRDPQFDPRTPAVYYLRAIEIPTPRWSTLLAAKRGLPVPTTAPATIQERAWSSPIWYTPPPARTASAARIARR
jgi:hypothetical protein